MVALINMPLIGFFTGPGMRILLICLILVVGGCRSHPFGPDVPIDLTASVKLFEDTVRWGDLENMYRFMQPDDDREIEIQKGLDNIRVTGYETSQLRELVDDDQGVDEARWAQTAVIDYVLTDQQVVRQLTDDQIWVSEDGGKTWLRTTPVPQFR